MSNWTETELGQVADLSWGDTSTTKASYTRAGWPAYSASGLDGLLPHFDHSEDGVVISAIGAKCGKTWLARNEWSCIKNTMWMRGRPHQALTDYLYYATSDPDFWPRRGAAQPFISLEDAKAARVTLPAVVTQRRVAALLSAFDELIEINEQRIELLENLARSLYREWFARFRFPGHEAVELADSELGAIPRGWSVRPLFEVADVGFGYAFKSERFSGDGSMPVIRIRDIPRGVTDTFTDEEAEGRYRVCDGDVLVGMDGEFYVRQWSGGDAWLNQRVARVRPLQGLSARHLMLAVADPIRAWNESISGTTVAHLGKRHLEATYLLVPPASILSLATPRFDVLAARQLECYRVNRRLTATRDLLLPRLVTGQLDISDLDLGDLLPAEAE